MKIPHLREIMSVSSMSWLALSSLEAGIIEVEVQGEPVSVSDGFRTVK